MLDWHSIPNARDSIPWYRDTGRLKLKFYLSIVMIGMILNGYDATLIAGLQAFDPWHADLGNPGGPRVGLLNAAGFVAGFIVGPVIAWIDMHLGRRWGVRFYGYTITIGTVISLVAGLPNINGYTVFLVGRFIIGFGQASFYMTSLAIVQEITHPHSRETVAQAWNTYYIVGIVLSSWVCFGTSFLTTSWTWRIPYIVQLPMSVFVLIAVQFMPESPRWLIDKGREAEALRFLIDCHGNGNENDELVLFEFAEMKEAIKREHEAKGETWATILRVPANRHRIGLAALTTVLTNLSGATVINFYYTVAFEQVGITDPTTQTGIAAGLNIFTWVVEMAAIFVGKHVGRKKIVLWTWPTVLLGLIGICASSGVFQTATDRGDDVTAKAAGVATVAMIWIYLGCFNFANPVLFAYPAEIQTYSMRTKGLLVWNCATQLEYAYVVFVDAIGLESIGYKYYAVYMPLVLIQFVLVWLYMVETKGYTLEEIARAFGDEPLDTPVGLPQVMDQIPVFGPMGSADLGVSAKHLAEEK